MTTPVDKGFYMDFKNMLLYITWYEERAYFLANW